MSPSAATACLLPGWGTVNSSSPLLLLLLYLQAPGALILHADLDEYLVTSSPMTAKQVSEVRAGAGSRKEGSLP